MKQLLFLLLFPCLALAQYQGNANQKITLGEQTTADGLVWRGRLADTANLLTNKLDTSVYIVLDTGTRAMWYYRASTTPKWTRLVDSLNNLQGTLSVAKGGTGSATQNFVDLTTAQSVNGVKTFLDTIIVNKGIRFPATQSASTNVNTLDDYEEGFFTVQLKFGGNNTGYTYYGNGGIYGRYTKIGDLCAVTIMIGILSKAGGASTGAATITGLPFNSSNFGVTVGGGINIADAINIDGATFYILSNTSTIILQNGNGINLTDANFGSFQGEVHMNFVYQIN